MAMDKKILAKIEAARLQYLEKQRPFRPGPEWFTAAEYAEDAGLGSREGGRRRLDPMVKDGLLESRKVGRELYYRAAP